MVWRRRFLRFLKEEGVYGEWVYNIRKQHPTTDLDFWEKKWKNEVLSEENKCIEGIFYAFYWDDTRQGRHFWSKLNNKWTYNCRNFFYYI